MRKPRRSALLADRPLMLLDEPTAHLDPATADALAGELLAATSGRTALIVTHRPAQTPGIPEVHIGRLGWRPSRPAETATVPPTSRPLRSTP